MEKNFIIAGFGGQGVLLAGEVLASDEEVSAVNKIDTDYVIALNQASFDRFLKKIKNGGHMIANSTLVKEIKTEQTLITFLHL